ncbi:hypothetical protein BC628DRAFT_77168 [Trametes gibbosa]|nr:hypothetical protein BC628DRAFT_77168 [Trametes gibbosa]
MRASNARALRCRWGDCGPTFSYNDARGWKSHLQASLSSEDRTAPRLCMYTCQWDNWGVRIKALSTLEHHTLAFPPSAPSRPPFFALTNEALSEVTRSLATKLDGRSASFIEMMDNASANMKLSDPVLRKNGMALWCSLLRRASVEADGQRATGDSPATEEAPVAGPSTAAPSKRADTGMVRSVGSGDVPLTKDHDSVTCRWNGCEMAMKGQDFKAHLLGYDARGHRAHIDGLAGAGKYTHCHWDGCRAPEMKVASLKRHVLNMHVQMDRYRCSRCGTTKRKDAYLSQHGPARLLFATPPLPLTTTCRRPRGVAWTPAILWMRIWPCPTHTPSPPCTQQGLRRESLCPWQARPR